MSKTLVAIGEQSPDWRRHFRRAFAVVALGAVILLILAGCGDDAESSTSITTTTGPRNDFTVPDWIDSVYPPDDGDAAVPAVEVEYGLLGPRQEIRLVIDGVDVTSQTDGIKRQPEVGLPGDPRAGAADRFPSPGTLRYEPIAVDSPVVELTPGEHLATAKLVELEEFGGTLRTVDEYDWSFRFQ